MTTVVANELYKRGRARLEIIAPHLPVCYTGTFFIAGGAIASPNPHTEDIDIFPHRGSEKPELTATREHVSANAVTYRTPPTLTQVSSLWAGNLQELLAGFDLTHCQAGVEVAVSRGKPTVSDVYFTEEYVLARATGTTQYNSAPGPLRTLLRLPKYYYRGEITRESYARAMVAALTELLEHPPYDRDDFWRQLVGMSESWELFSGDPELDLLYAALQTKNRAQP